MVSFRNKKSQRLYMLAGTAVVTALVTGVALGMAFSTSPVQAQGPTFNAGTAIMMNFVDAGATAEFESVMRKLSEALQSSDNPERSQQAAGWKLYRADVPGPSNNVIYIWYIDPVVSGADYSVAQILFDEFPSEVQGLYEQFEASLGLGQQAYNLQLVLDF